MAHKSLKSNKPAPRTIAPSQLKKMVRIEHISAQVIPCTARQSFVACGMSVEAGEKYFLVQSDRFPGYAYIVRWNETSAQYDCSCGNPRCTAHTKHVSTYVHMHPATPAKKEVLPCSVEWYAARREEEKAKEAARIAEKALVAQIQSEFASVVVDTIAASINAQFGKSVVRRGIFLLSQKEAA